jgi:carboxylesterase type B
VGRAPAAQAASAAPTAAEHLGAPVVVRPSIVPQNRKAVDRAARMRAIAAVVSATNAHQISSAVREKMGAALRRNRRAVDRNTTANLVDCAARMTTTNTSARQDPSASTQ